MSNSKDITLDQLEARFRLAQSGTFDWQMFGELAMTWARGAQAKIDDAARVEDELRTMFAVSYSNSALYTDDGELQDNSMQPNIDFKRDSPAEILSKQAERAVQRLRSQAAAALAKR